MVPSIGADGGHAQGANIAVLRMAASAPPYRSNLESTGLYPDVHEWWIAKAGRCSHMNGFTDPPLLSVFSSYIVLCIVASVDLRTMCVVVHLHYIFGLIPRTGD